VGQSGIAGKTGATTATDLGSEAILSARRVTLSALVPSLWLHATSSSKGAGFYSEGIDDATADTTASNTVTIGARAQLTGTEGVDLRTSFANVDTYADSYARSTGPSDGSVKDVAGNTPNGNPGPYPALAFYVSTANGSVSAGMDGHVSKRSLAAGGGDEDGSGAVATQRVVFDSDVLILSGRSPRLVVDADGTITEAVNVTVGPTQQTSGPVVGDTIVVNNITNPGPGTVFFDSPTIANTSPGAKGTWTFRDTLSSVLLSNASALPMQVNDISVLSSAQPIVDLQGPTVTLLFTIRRDVAPTLIEILGTHAAVAPAVDGPAIIINGVIDNPIGTTKVRNEFGPILGSGVRAVDTSGDPASLIRTNVVILETPHSSIGTAATRLNVDTVAVENAAGEPVYPPTTTVQRFTVAAGDSLYLDVRGILRVPRPATPTC